MRIRMIALCVLSMALAAAADVTGRWVARMSTDPTDPREITFYLKQSGNQISGTVGLSNEDAPIVEGRVEGDAITFVATLGAQQRRVEYKAVPAGDQLKVTLP